MHRAPLKNMKTTPFELNVSASQLHCFAFQSREYMRNGLLFESGKIAQIKIII